MKKKSNNQQHSSFILDRGSHDYQDDFEKRIPQGIHFHNQDNLETMSLMEESNGSSYNSSLSDFQLAVKIMEIALMSIFMMIPLWVDLVVL